MARRSRFAVGPTMVLVVIASFGVGLFMSPPPPLPPSLQRSGRFEHTEAFPPAPLRVTDCVTPNDQERALVHAAVDALRFPWSVGGFFTTGAQRLLARLLDRGFVGHLVIVCDEPAEYARAAKLLDETEDLRSARRDQDNLRFVARLPTVNEGVAESVAQAAFSDVALSDDLYEDYRPFARSVLASLGPHARRYAAQAFAVMGSADPLRTGAAQIAVAGRHPGALDAVERLMSRRLARVPVGAVVPWDDEIRLDELSYALAFGGPDARAHVGPLRAFMTRKVQSWAPQFGMIEGVPRAMCEVLSRITGIEEAALGYAYCGER